MKWSPQQDAALVGVDRWLKTEDQVFHLFGYAGTGKSTLIRHIAENVDGDVCFAAFTGKAASVLRRMGCGSTSTIHKLIYKPIGELRQEAKELAREVKELAAKGENVPMHMVERLDELRDNINRGPHFVLREELDVHPELIIIDEVSMVDETVGRDLLSFGVKVLVVGDPGQLPPVRGTGYFVDVTPEAMLTEVHRQALDSPIIRMATHVRTHGANTLPYDEFHVDPRGRMTKDDYLRDVASADQLLVGKHVTRRNHNMIMRKMSEYTGGMPLVGEKIICMRNNHQIGLLNGTLWIIKECKETPTGYYWATLASADDENVTLGDVLMHKQPFLGEEVPPEDKLDANEFDFGYALTVHKAQGSQWGSVTIIDDWRGSSRDQWVYTALTRAVDKVMLLRSSQ